MAIFTLRKLLSSTSYPEGDNIQEVVDRSSTPWLKSRFESVGKDLSQTDWGSGLLVTGKEAKFAFRAFVLAWNGDRNNGDSCTWL